MLEEIFTMIDLDDENLHPILNNEDSEEESGVATIHEQKVERPRRFKVLIHNDDYTTMEFVIHILMKHFSKTMEQAEQIMLKVHHEGVGICGVYTHEIAETKVAKVKKEAEEQGHPLLCTYEPAD